MLRPLEPDDALGEGEAVAVAEAASEGDAEAVEDVVAKVVEPGMSVSVLIVGTPDERTLNCAMAGA